MGSVTIRYYGEGVFDHVLEGEAERIPEGLLEDHLAMVVLSILRSRSVIVSAAREKELKANAS